MIEHFQISKLSMRERILRHSLDRPEVGPCLGYVKTARWSAPANF